MFLWNDIKSAFARIRFTICNGRSITTRSGTYTNTPSWANAVFSATNPSASAGFVY